MDTLADAIEYAIKWEKKAKKQYLKWSQQVRDEKTGEILGRLSKMEQKHIELLKSL